jgi:hypothetical protein
LPERVGSSEGLGVDERLKPAVHLAGERSLVARRASDSKTIFEVSDCARLVYLVMRADYEEQLLVQLADFLLPT